MRLSCLRKVTNRLMLVAIGAALATATHAGVRWWDDAETASRVAGTWAVEGPYGDPQVKLSVCEFRSDGTFWTRATGLDGSLKYVSWGRWWVSQGQLYKTYDMNLDGQPGRPGDHPERVILVRADSHGMIVAGSAGWQVRYQRLLT